MTKFRPISGKHSVEQAIVGVRLLEDAGEHAFTRAVEVAANLQTKYELPGRMQSDSMSLGIGRQVISHGFRLPSSEIKNGTIFQRANPSGLMECELTVEQGAVTFRTREYKRWDDLRIFINGLLAPVVDALCEGKVKRLSVIEFRCLDKFESVEEDTFLVDLIDKETVLVPDYLKEMKQLLHSHLGWFESVSENGRTLINVNLSLSDESSRRVATILQIMSRQSNGKQASYFGRKKVSGVLSDVLDELHSRDKAVLGNLLNSDLKNLIGLDGDSGVSAL